MVPGIIVGVIVLLLVGFVVGTYNGLIKAKVTVEEAFATMDVYLKKRFDLIPNVVETVKGYAKHEVETLEKIVGMRTGSYDSMSAEEKLEAGTQIGKAIPQIMALAESYPELKANENFMELSKQLERVEEDIANSRKYYNGAVKQYNLKVQMFPGNIIAGMFGFTPKKMFEVEDAAQRENVKVSF